VGWGSAGTRIGHAVEPPPHKKARHDGPAASPASPARDKQKGAANDKGKDKGTDKGKDKGKGKDDKAGKSSKQQQQREQQQQRDSKPRAGPSGRPTPATPASAGRASLDGRLPRTKSLLGGPLGAHPPPRQSPASHYRTHRPRRVLAPAEGERVAELMYPHPPARC
jgi:hypothetical protein